MTSDLKTAIQLAMSYLQEAKTAADNKAIRLHMIINRLRQELDETSESIGPKRRIPPDIGSIPVEELGCLQPLPAARSIKWSNSAMEQAAKGSAAETRNPPRPQGE
jgi:hypothetical protein